MTLPPSHSPVEPEGALSGSYSAQRALWINRVVTANRAAVAAEEKAYGRRLSHPERLAVASAVVTLLMPRLPVKPAPPAAPPALKQHWPQPPSHLGWEEGKEWDRTQRTRALLFHSPEELKAMGLWHWATAEPSPFGPAMMRPY